jgi:hypothetical protein
VEVRDALTGSRPGVRHDAKTGFAHAFPLREVGRDLEQATEERCLLPTEIGGGRDVLARDQQDVDGSARRDVAERHDLVVLVDDIRWHLTGRDPAEETVRIGRHSLDTMLLRTRRSYQSRGFDVIRNPITPTAAAIR